MKTAEERFFEKVEQTDACWNWTASKSSVGYGMFRLTAETGMITAHRFSWMLHNRQPIPAGLFVCHRCDNRSCVRPDHLFLGTPKDNTIDMMQKGRWVGRGEKPEARVPRERFYVANKVEKSLHIVKLKRENGESLPKIAAYFGCDSGVIQRVLEKHGLYAPIKSAPHAPHNVRTSEVREHLTEILERYGNGENINSLALSFGTAHQTMSKIIRTANIAGHAEDICSPLAA